MRSNGRNTQEEGFLRMMKRFVKEFICLFGSDIGRVLAFVADRDSSVATIDTIFILISIWALAISIEVPL